MIWNPDTRQGVLLATGLPQLSLDRVYELWAFAALDQPPMPAGTFTVDEHGCAVFDMPAMEDERAIVAFAVSLEPGLMPAPTGPVHLLGAL